MQMKKETLVGRWLALAAVTAVLAVGPAYGQIADSSQVVTPEALVEDAIKKLDAGDIEGAARIHEQVRRIKPDLHRLKLVYGLLLVETGRQLEALPVFEEFNGATREVGNEWRGFAAVGRIYKDSRMPRQAVRPLERAKDFAPIELDGRPIKAEIAIDLASALQALKRTRDAVKVADEAASLAPNDAGIQLKLGRMHLDTQDYTAALRSLDRAHSLVIAQLRADPFKAQDNARLKQIDELRIAIYQAQRAANPDDPSIYLELGRALRSQAESERRQRLLTAREFALESVNRDPRMHASQIFLARIEWELGGVPDALERLKRLLEEDPNNAEAQRLRAEIQESVRIAAGP